jgi:uncharacterized membrane protein YgcG
MAFPDLIRPSGLRYLLGPRLPQNQSGFQGAHIIGNRFWRDDIDWLTAIGFLNDQDTTNNGVLLPESERGNAVLGAANHIGNHFGAFDRLFYDVNSTNDAPSNLFLNKVERDRRDERNAATLAFSENPPALAIKLAEIDRDYRIQVRNFLDFAKILFLHDDILDGLGFGDQECLVLNTADARFVGRDAVLARFEELATFNGGGQSTGLGVFDFGEVTTNPFFLWIKGLRGEGVTATDDTIDDVLLREKADLGRILYPSGAVGWTVEVRADILGRDAVLAGHIQTVGGVERIDYQQGFLPAITSEAYDEVIVPEILRGLAALSTGDVQTSTSFYVFLDRLRDTNTQLFSGIFDNLYDALRTPEVDGLPAIPVDLQGSVNAAADLHNMFNVNDDGRVLVGRTDLPESMRNQLAATAAALLYAQLKMADAAQRLGYETPAFKAWLANAAQSDDLSLVVEQGGFAVTAAVLREGGVVTIDATGGPFNWSGLRDLIKEFERQFPDGHVLHEVAEAFKQTGDLIDKVYATIDALPDLVGGILNKALEQTVDAFTKGLLTTARIATGRTAILQDRNNQVLLGLDSSALVGGAENDLLIHNGSGLALGGAGDDVLIGILPDVLESGNSTGGVFSGFSNANGGDGFTGGGGSFGGGGATGEGWGDPVDVVSGDAIQQLFLDGGEGKDWVYASGGTQAVTIGGLSRDWIYNTSAGGVIWGDIEGSRKQADGSQAYWVTQKNAQGQDVRVQKTVADDRTNSDNFWYAPDVTIMDAQHSDVLKFYGITLTGGEVGSSAWSLLAGGLSGNMMIAQTVVGGVASAAAAVNIGRQVAGLGPIYYDTWLPFIAYTLVKNDEGGEDLIVHNMVDSVIGTLTGSGSTSRMVIKNYDASFSSRGVNAFYSGLNAATTPTGDLGMLFRDFNPLYALAANDNEKDACIVGNRRIVWASESVWGVAA